MNKDRLGPLKDLVEFLQKRNYCNITIVDNKSTYPQLLNWYKVSGAKIFNNTTSDTGIDSVNSLAYTHRIPEFLHPMMTGNFILTDSDIVPVSEIPVGFVEDLTEICNKYRRHKVGLGLKIDDVPDHFYNKKKMLDIETMYWKDALEGEKMLLYPHPIDTTFAVYSPGTIAKWGSGGTCFRTGGNYVARHIPWYYDYNNLPEDEKYYIKNLAPNTGACWSLWAKEVVK
jgi:hypothetical protein